jgi:vacuolar-type H+-ATPase subunit H
MSEKSLNQLIKSLKTEAIEAAREESEKILANARMEAKRIVQTAEEKKTVLITEAKQEAQAILQKGEAALQQAGRDYSISVRNELLNVFQAVLETEIRREFTPDLLKTAILKVVENIGGDVELKLPSKDAKELAEYVQSRLKSSEKVVAIMEDKSNLDGFTIAKKKEGWSYSVTPEEVTEGHKKHLNKNWLEILKQQPTP